GHKKTPNNWCPTIGGQFNVAGFFDLYINFLDFSDHRPSLPILEISPTLYRFNKLMSLAAITIASGI
ncbi:hypothetical protein, partial [Vibrio crassostreae]|uniref:hypothetical protein n=1 Tax=Vibrio crassostreae TaxID=246167 RepID=UPI001B30C511